MIGHIFRMFQVIIILWAGYIVPSEDRQYLPLTMGFCAGGIFMVGVYYVCRDLGSRHYDR